MLAPETLTPLIRTARPEDLPAVRALFLAYIAHIGAPECFPSFEAELASLPGRYAPPVGQIFLACLGDQITGVAALRPFDESPAEVKRLFGAPAFHNRPLMDDLIARAQRRLNTVPGAGYSILLLSPGSILIAVA